MNCNGWAWHLRFRILFGILHSPTTMTMRQKPLDAKAHKLRSVMEDSGGRIESSSIIMTPQTSWRSARRSSSSTRRSFLYESIDSAGNSLKDIMAGTARGLRNFVEELSHSFDSFRNSLSRSFSSMPSKSKIAAHFRMKVFGDLEAVNSVDHAALLQGYGLPKLDRKNYSPLFCVSLCLQLTLSQCVCMLFLQERRCKGFWWRESLTSKRPSRC